MTFSAHAATAAHRFGLGEADLARVGADPSGWLRSQIGPADLQPGTGLATAADGLRAHARFIQIQRRPVAVTAEAPAMAAEGMAAPRSVERAFVEHFREITQADQRAHVAAAVASQRPFAERLALFWANHFTVSQIKASTRALIGAFEREAIRPHIAGNFRTLLKASTTHGTMLRYLDNDRSAGPHSLLAQRRVQRNPRAEALRDRPTGLNENLAREVLELHTLGAASQAYTQADVTAFAAVLTGWRILPRPQDMLDLPSDARVAGFDPDWHEPGEKTVLGQRIAEGAGGLDQVLELLVRHPATAQFIALKLARHFVADDPPATLVQRLAQRFQRSDGDLPALYAELIGAPEAWVETPQKLKTPAEWVISSWRLLGIGPQVLQRQPDAGISTLGQRLQAAPSPAGWPDRQEEWLGPDAVWKRVEWATRAGERMGLQVDARELARRALGPRLSEATAQQIARAADGPQALALLLLSPEFLRR
ncbi:MAG: DUF1800 domain-containing protein [Rubrivivax sp.]|nr:DUF1800 domain-containing protein [Rubrivivax sp.]